MTGAQLTTSMKDELVAHASQRAKGRAAELTTFIRLAAEITSTATERKLRFSVDHEATAQLISSLLHDYGIDAQPERAAQQPRKGVLWELVYSEETAPVSRYGGTSRIDMLQRELGLLTRSGYAVVGFPPPLVSGSVLEAECVWRAALLCRGTLTAPERGTSLEVACPGPETALALSGFARRLGQAAKSKNSKDSRAGERISVRDVAGVGAILTRLGAYRTRMQWEDARRRAVDHASSHRLANFDDANLRRSARAAIVSALRCERALEILGPDVSDHLLEAGQLRLSHRQASLEKLGKLADPPITKDAVAGRLRRLNNMADKRAKELGIPTTEAAATDELVDAYLAQLGELGAGELPAAAVDLDAGSAQD